MLIFRKTDFYQDKSQGVKKRLKIWRMIYFIEHLFKWGTITAYSLLTKGQFKKKAKIQFSGNLPSLETYRLWSFWYFSCNTANSCSLTSCKVKILYSLKTMIKLTSLPVTFKVSQKRLKFQACVLFKSATLGNSLIEFKQFSCRVDRSGWGLAAILRFDWSIQIG